MLELYKNMQINKILIILVTSFILVSCAQVPCRKGLEHRPMYGKTQKCKQQLLEDEQFIKNSEAQYGSKKAASEAMLRFAWKHYVDGNLDASMERFNQAWLLDSLNSEVYIGFANILSDQGKFEESVEFTQHSLNLHPESSDNVRFLGLTYENLYFQTKREEYLDLSIEQFKKSILLNPDNSFSYAMLAEVYNLANKNDSARKYMEIADTFNPALIKPELREKIAE